MKINIEIVNKINNIKHQVNHVKILQKQKADCVNLVLKKLKLKNVNELRDKFEGVKFYENYFQQFKCILALESVLNKKIIDWEKVRENPNLIFNDSKMEYQIVHFNYENYPKIDNANNKDAVVFLIKEEMKILVLGKLSYEEIKNKENYKELKLSDSRIKPTFHAIEKITELKKIEK